MNNIKNRFIVIAMAGVLAVGPVACGDDFLNVPVTGQLSEAQFQSEEGLQGLLIGTYTLLNGREALGWFSGSSNWLWGSIRGGDANKGTNAGDFATMNPFVRFEASPSDPELMSKWNGSYEGVARANTFLANLAASEQVADERKTAMAAEARFLRAHYYFELRKNFKNVPWVTEEMSDAEAAKVTNTEEILPKIETELQFAYDNLPAIQSQIGRVNKWAAASYLAKVYMFQQKYADAKQLFDLIITQGVTSGGQKYALVPEFDDIFRGANENNPESIFAFQAAAGTGSTSNANHDLAMNYPYNPEPAGPGGCCGFFAPSFELANSYRTTSEGLPYLNGEYNQPANALKTDQGLLSDQAFTPDAGPVDPRLDHTIGRRGLPFLDWADHPGFAWIRDQAHAGPYTQKKLSYQEDEAGSYLETSGWTPGYHSINFMIIRFADVLLMAAEAEIELGNLPQALEYVNMVRERAANSPLLREDGTPAANYVISTYPSFPSQEYARQAVRMERKLELALEGKRYYDLLRWGVVAEAMNNYLNYEAQFLPIQFAGAKFDPGRDEYLPIPQVQIDLQGSDVLTQNPGYN